MAAGGAVIGLGLVGLNRLLQQGIDPEKLLDSAIEQMEADLRNAHQASITLVASQKRLQQQYAQAQAEVSKWEGRAQLALQKDDEFLAREALSRKKMHAGILSSVKDQLNQKPASVKTLKQNITLLEAKIAEAKVMRTRLKAQIAAAKANGQLQSTVGRLSTSRAMSAFERMEDKVLQMEARSQAAAELAGADLESQFAFLESGNSVDDELAAMKAYLLGSAPQEQVQLPGTTTAESTVVKASSTATPDPAVNDELEALKTKLDQL
ncbi:MAG: PspA/IM30 family protein [Lyngbya sp. HA4199-MV5]|nr:PspA/IM30 family protein [Lyngbya sp. HA4199-MV5]